jgi:signal transduction histidine kinase
MATEPLQDAMARLVTVIQELSLARDVTTVMAIVRQAARALTGADGASFVLREGDVCYYADEEAIGPLWKGQRFPMSACISGWAMLHRQHAVVEDIYADTRIPTAAYEPTFVKSLVMVPIRTVAPIGAIGTYWAQRHRATPEEVAVLQALADSTAVALANVHLYAELEQRVAERTAALQREMAERQRLEQEAQRAAHFARLGRLAAGVAHEIRNPLGAVFLHVDVMREELQHPSPDSATALDEALTEITRQLSRLEDLVEDYLSLVRVVSLERTPQDLGTFMQTWVPEWEPLATARGVTLRLESLERLGTVAVHPSTLRRAVLNLVQNALDAMPQGGTLTLAGQGTAAQVHLEVRDTGRGIPAAQRAHIFEPLYTTKPGGTGLGLYLVHEIVTAHGGHVTVQSIEGQGTTFALTLPRAAAVPAPQEACTPPAD